MTVYSFTARFEFETDSDVVAISNTQFASAIQYAGGRRVKIHVERVDVAGKQASCVESPSVVKNGGLEAGGSGLHVR